MTSRDELRQLCQQHGELLHMPARRQLLVRIEQGDRLKALANALAERGFYLVTLAATDERELIDRCFKMVYLWSHPGEDLLIFAEQPLGQGGKESPTAYTPLDAAFRAVTPLQEELADMLGLQPTGAAVETGRWLHPECYPPELYPLRRDRTTALLCTRIDAHRTAGDASAATSPAPADGEWLLTAGPIHAGVIEPGQFLFRLAGEVVEGLRIRLGYTHKGTERLFQARQTLADGWRLAEHVAGDAPFAHSLAYCRAAEALARVEPSPEATAARALFLELERMAAHVGDCAALAHDVAADLAYAQLSDCRERLLDLNLGIAGRRLLQGLNRPGGIILPRPPDIAGTMRTVRAIADDFAQVANELAQWPAFRSRLQWTGILTRHQALRLGCTGPAARASGIRRDFRLQHPIGIDAQEDMRRILETNDAGRGRFVADDIADPALLRDTLRNPNGALQQNPELAPWISIMGYVAGRLSLSPLPGAESQDPLVAALNELLDDPELPRQAAKAFPAGRDRETLLSDEERLALAEPEATRDLSRLNRLLLEDAFPGMLRNTHEIADREATAGDALARFIIRVREVATSAELIERCILPHMPDSTGEFCRSVEFKPACNYEFAVGWAESWRGDVVYWLMQDKFGRIFRCKVRDPSTFNWPALQAAVEPHELDALYLARYRPSARRDNPAQIIVADFPIVNKSFSLSYSGNDL